MRELPPAPLWELSIERTRAAHTIQAGAGQLWPITSAMRRFRRNQPLQFRTDTLAQLAGSTSWKLVTVNPALRVSLDQRAILHGVVFGDGAYHRQAAGSGRQPFCQVYLCNDPNGCDSRQLAPLFEASGYRPVVREDKQQVRFYGLPAGWKTLPSASESASYLRGIIAGWFAADGHVDSRSPLAILTCAKRAPLEWLQQVAPRAGLAVSTQIGLRRSHTTFGPGEWYSLGIAASTLDMAFFILADKRARSRPAQFVKAWKIVSARPLQMVEPVYSATTACGHFTIEGNILVVSAHDREALP